MGKCKLRYLLMHAVFRDPHKTRSPDLKAMGNDKANTYWEAELPPNYGRVGIENFIPKYEEKRWVAKDGRERSPYTGGEETNASYLSRPEERSGHRYVSKPENVYEDKRRINSRPSNTRVASSTGKFSFPTPPKGLEQEVKKPETTATQEVTKPVADIPSVAAPPKVYLLPISLTCFRWTILILGPDFSLLGKHQLLRKPMQRKRLRVVRSLLLELRTYLVILYQLQLRRPRNL